MSKLPAFQFYPGDWLKDPNLRRCSPGARGVYIDILCIMFEHAPRGILAEPPQELRLRSPETKPHFMFDSCGLVCEKGISILCKGFAPWSIAELAGTINGIDIRTAAKYIHELIKKRVIKRLEDGTMVSMRLVRDESIRLGKKYNGRKGGVKTQANAKQSIKQNRGSSSSSSSSSSDIKNSRVENAIKEIKQKYPKRAGSNPWPDAESQIKTRITEATFGMRKKKQKEIVVGELLISMFRGTQRYQVYCDAEGLTETRTVMQAKRFFGKNKEFLDDWTPSKQTDKQKLQSIRFPAKGNVDAWVKFALSHQIGTKPGESQFDFERRVRNRILNDLDKR